MGLSDAADKLVRNYSGGMIRKMEIAQSMLHRPRVLFLDEPTVGLDPLARQAVWKHIEELRANYDTTIFLTTHYLEEADALCSRVAVMHLGKMVALGSPADLKASIGGNGVTLNEVFAHYTDEEGEENSKRSYHDTGRTRRVAKRLG
jgi:ABC-2 type transport system ATP-binding protein